MVRTSLPPILWRQTLGLVAVQGAITLLWVIYNLYLSKLLTPLGFPKEMLVLLMVVENGLAMILEPVMGSLSDRQRTWVGIRFPVIIVGALLSSALFIAIPAIALFGIASTGGILIGVILAWAMAMAIFRSPLVALIGQCAQPSHLPWAMSCLTLINGAIGAVGSFGQEWLLSFGPPVAFAVGSLVLLGAVAIVRQITLSTLPEPPVHITEAGWGDFTVISSQVESAPVHPRANFVAVKSLGLILAVGVGVALGGMLMRNLLNLGQPTGAPKWALIVFTVTHLLSAIPAGALAVHWAKQSLLLKSLGAMALGVILLGLFHGTGFALIIAAGLGITLSFVANGAVPFALSLVPADRSGLGTGIFFAGAGLASAFFGAVITPALPIAPVYLGLIGTIALIAAGIGVALSPVRPDQSPTLP
jgi:hypothetical protein